MFTMIITKLERLIVDDYPLIIEEALTSLCANKTKIFNEEIGSYEITDQITYKIQDSIDYISSSWKSYLKNIQIYLIIEGEFYLECSDIDDMRKISDSSNILFYEGSKQARIKLSNSSIAILFPEDVHRILSSFHNIHTKYCQLSIQIK